MKKTKEKLIEEEKTKMEGSKEMLERFKIIESFLTRRSFASEDNDLTRGKIQQQIRQAERQLKMSEEFLEFLNNYNE